LVGIEDPEAKRKTIGRLDIFEEQAAKLGAQFLAQGTLYPDVIERMPESGLTVFFRGGSRDADGCNH
jgi:GMP synthase (glutamine-hydrolysing)